VHGQSSQSRKQQSQLPINVRLVASLPSSHYLRSPTRQFWHQTHCSRPRPALEYLWCVTRLQRASTATNVVQMLSFIHAQCNHSIPLRWQTKASPTQKSHEHALQSVFLPSSAEPIPVHVHDPLSNIASLHHMHVQKRFRPPVTFSSQRYPPLDTLRLDCDKVGKTVRTLHFSR
jgi:hypothetical protein